MRKLFGLAVGILVLACASSARAQVGSVAMFTWVGAPDAWPGNLSVQLASINGQTPDEAIGYSGAIGITNGIWLSLHLPEPLTDPPGAYNFPTFPNNGSLQALDCTKAVYKVGPGVTVQWGIRPDGTTMDGTKPGDWYYITATSTCTEWNGTATVTVTAFREFINVKLGCRFGRCSYALEDIMQSGTGTATVDTLQ